MNQQKLRLPVAAFLFLASLLLSASNEINLLLYAISRPEAGMLFSALGSFAIFVLNAVLCVMLFAKKRGNGLLMVAAIHTVRSLIWVLRYRAVGNFLDLAAYAILLVIVVVLSEQTLIKGEFEKLRGTVGSLFFLPALLMLVSFVIMHANYIRIGVVFRANLGSYISQILEIAAIFAMAAWLKNPWGNASTSGNVSVNGNVSAAVNEEYADGYCGLGKFILLSLFTFGIWPLVWIYRTTKFLNRTPGVEQYRPGAKLLLCMFIPFYQIYWLYKHGQRIDTFSKYKKLNNSDLATLCLVLGIFIPIVACIIMQDRINTICKVPAAAAAATTDPEALMLYKDLLDKGVITQEEFDAKKKQLLGL